MKRGLIVLFFSSVSVLLQAQHPFIDEFRAEQVAGGVFLQWTLKAGSICNGIQIERKVSESGALMQIGEIEGVCGDVSEPVSYSFTDTSPVLGTINFYRLYLGGFGHTDEVELFAHDFRQEEFALTQDLIGHEIKLLPRRPETGRNYIVYSIDGRQKSMGEVEASVETRVDISNLSRGIYVIQVLDDENSIFSSVFLKWH